MPACAERLVSVGPDICCHKELGHGGMHAAGGICWEGATNKPHTTALEDFCRLGDGELLRELQDCTHKDAALYAVASWARREGWTEVRTLRAQIVVLHHVYEGLFKLRVSELESHIPEMTIYTEKET